MTNQEYIKICELLTEIAEKLNELSRVAYESVPPFDPPYTITDEEDRV